jgi:hypothetical protein
VSAQALPRTLRILDALFWALEKDSCTLEWPKPYDKPLEIVNDSEKAQIFIAENVERREHKPTSEEAERKKRDYWWQLPP